MFFRFRKEFCKLEKIFHWKEGNLSGDRVRAGKWKYPTERLTILYRRATVVHSEMREGIM